VKDATAAAERVFDALHEPFYLDGKEVVASKRGIATTASEAWRKWCVVTGRRHCLYVASRTAEDATACSRRACGHR
jgi:hypothetical protein